MGRPTPVPSACLLVRLHGQTTNTFPSPSLEIGPLVILELTSNLQQHLLRLCALLFFGVRMSDKYSLAVKTRRDTTEALSFLSHVCHPGSLTAVLVLFVSTDTLSSRHLSSAFSQNPSRHLHPIHTFPLTMNYGHPILSQSHLQPTCA